MRHFNTVLPGKHCNEFFQDALQKHKLPLEYEWVPIQYHQLNDLAINLQEIGDILTWIQYHLKNTNTAVKIIKTIWSLMH